MGAPVKGPLLSDPEIAEILRKVYLSQRKAVFSTAFPRSYRAIYDYCFACHKEIPEPDREPHEMWHRLMEAP